MAARLAGHVPHRLQRGARAVPHIAPAPAEVISEGTAPEVTQIAPAVTARTHRVSDWNEAVNAVIVDGTGQPHVQQRIRSSRESDRASRKCAA